MPRRRIYPTQGNQIGPDSYRDNCERIGSVDFAIRCKQQNCKLVP